MLILPAIGQSPLPDTFNPGASNLVSELAVQADGKILVGGYFTTLGGQTCNYLGRLNPDGTLDAGFNPAASSYVYCLAVQADGKILVGGYFTTLGRQTRNYIGRLNPDGTLDTGFNPGASSEVVHLALQADGKILVSGYFGTLGGQSRSYIGRLNPDGTLDPGFNPNADGPASSLVLQTDGKILVGGYFTTLGGQTCNYLGRLNPDGTLDAGFNPAASSYVYCLAVQADGKILVGGRFTTLGGQARSCIGRLNPDGTLDIVFNPGANSAVSSLALQADGKILVGGRFTTLGGQARNYLGRLNPDGTLDTGFNPGASSEVGSLALQADGKILVGGRFTTLGGQARNYLGRLNATDPAMQNLTYDGSTITWLRGGTCPEVWRTVFDWSSDGLLWTPLGQGNRVLGGWQRPNAVVPVDATIRARGFVAGGYVEKLVTNRPDLQVASWDTSLQAVAGALVNVSWTLINRGRLPATNGWVDRVYLSPDATVASGWLLGEFPVSEPLATNVPLARSQSVTLPTTLEPDRDYWWIIVTDAANTINEENEINNTRVSELPMRVLPPPAPNLRVTSVSASANPMSGQPVIVTWAVTNAGTWSTGAGLWQDAVYLSADAVLDAGDLLLGRATRPRPLNTNESYPSSLTSTFPQGLSGARYFIVQTDTDNRVSEGPLENDNITASGPIAITLTPPPDLQVAGIQAPAAANSGESIAVSWTVTNAGPGLTAETNWTDDVYLSPTIALSTNAVLLGSFPHEGSLSNGTSYLSSNFLLLAPNLSGTFYLLVQTDSRSNVFEYVFETNNLAASGPISITLTPPPDLAVSEVVAPATAFASHALSVSYTVTNQGMDTLLTFFWEDRLYLTTNLPPHPDPLPQRGEGVIFLGSWWHFGDLLAGESYTNSFEATLPDGLSGSWYAVVETDAGNAVFELNKTNNVGASTAPILIESLPADLVVTGLTAPTSAQAGSSLLVSWTVRNQGTGDTAVNRWSDRVVLSADATHGNADDATLLLMEHNGLLAADGSYTVTNQVVSVPFSVAPGSWRLFVVTDSANAVYEGANEANNASAPRTITITRTTADLRVAEVEVRERTGMSAFQVLSEDQLRVSWRVENTGAASPNSAVWSDAIHLSTNSIFDTNAILLATAQNPVLLALGTFYTNTLEVTLPAEIQGTFYVHVLTDTASEVIEDNKLNNVLTATNALQVTLRPVPDIAVVSVATPTDGFSGQLFELSWSVTNRGPAAAEDTWFDSVYLSLDPQFEPTLDTYIGYAERPTALTNGQSYTQTALLKIPPEVSGLFYVFVVCDSTDRVNERGGETNNVGRAPMPVSVWIRLPSDLVVGTINIPTNAVSGYEMALTYVLRNQGTNAAFGPWVDALYLSADDQWDIGDALFGRVSQTGFLAVGGSRTNTVSAPAPGVLPGNYRVIIRTDVVNQVPETNEFNNVAATLDQVASQVDALELGVPATNSLANHQARYYRVHAAAGQWLVLELDCASVTAAIELYVRYGAIPTRSEFDFLHSNPLQPNHRIVVPNTREGDYYILVYGDFIPAPGSAAIAITARLPQFLVFDTTFGRGGNAGNLTIPINGVDFDRTCTVRLTNGSAGMPAGLNRPAAGHYYDSSARFYATLDLRDLVPGFYTVVVQSSNSAPVTIPDSLEVVASGPPPPVVPVVSAPSAMRRDVAYTFTVQWANTGLNDASAPLLTVGNTVPFGLSPGDYSLGTRYTFLGINTHGGPPGILRPGQTEMLTFHSRSGIEAGDYTAFADRAIKEPAAPYNWEPLRTVLRPDTMSESEFAVVFDRLVQRVGLTQGEYLAMLSRNSSLLPKALGDPRKPMDCLALEVSAAMADIQCALRGMIATSSSPLPVGNIRIKAIDPSSNLAFASVSWNDGTVVFSSLPPRRYELTADDHWLVNPRFLDTTTNCRPEGIAFLVRRGARVQGRVYAGASIGPFGGSDVELIRDGVAVKSTHTDAVGHYTFSGLEAGSYVVSGSAAGYAKAWSSAVVVSNALDATVDIQLRQQSTLTFSVMDDAGRPLSSVAVVAQQLNGPPYARYVALSEPRGEVLLRGLSEGTYDLRLMASGHMCLSLQGIAIGDGVSAILPLQVLRTHSEIRGNISGLGPQCPYEKVFVRVSQANIPIQVSQVDAEGNFAFSSLQAGEYLLQLLAWEPPQVVADLSVVLSPGQSLTNITLRLPVDCLNVGSVLKSQYRTTVPVSMADELNRVQLLLQSCDDELLSLSTALKEVLKSPLAGSGVLPGTEACLQRRLGREYIDDLYTSYQVCLIERLVLSAGEASYRERIRSLRVLDMLIADDDFVYDCAELLYDNIRETVSAAVLGKYEEDVANYLQKADLVPSKVAEAHDEVINEALAEIQSAAALIMAPSTTVESVVDLTVAQGSVCGECGVSLMAARATKGGKIVTVTDSCLAAMQVTDRSGEDEVVSWIIHVRGILRVETAYGILIIKICRDPSAPDCDPCKGPNPPPDCDPCKRPNPPDSCDDTDRPPTRDPNDIVGPGGFGPEYWISPEQTFHYTVRFENDPKEAEAPAQIVRITQQLSTNLDLRTFRLGVMGFGTNLVEVPAERTFYQTRLNLTNALGVLLDISASLDLARGEVTWEFFSLDPITGDLPFDPFLGFLPPNTNGIIGQGFVTYTIKPKAGITQGDIINAEARIFFDYNEPIDTPRIFNTVDTGLPTSTVLPLPATTNRNIFPVRWTGTDGYGGAGVASYTIYVSDNGGPWQLWLANTPYWEQLFVGECGHSYAFYSVARDNVGHVEQATAVAQAAIYVLPNTAPILEPITNRVIAVGQPMVITNTASDVDAPAQSLTFSLDLGAPVGMSVDAHTGRTTWKPECAQGNSLNLVTLRVTDDGCGSLSATQQFAVVVTECLQTALGAAVAQPGQSACVPVFLESSDGLTNLAFQVSVPEGRFTNFSIWPIIPQISTARVDSVTATGAVFSLLAQPGQEFRGPQQVADVCFTLLSPQDSAFVPLEVVDIIGLRANGTPVGNTDGRAGRAAVVSDQPLLEAVYGTNGQPALILYGQPGTTNILETTSKLELSNTWAFHSQFVIPPTNLFQVIQPICTNDCSLFFRARRAIGER